VLKVPICQQFNRLVKTMYRCFDYLVLKWKYHISIVTFFLKKNVVSVCKSGIAGK